MKKKTSLIGTLIILGVNTVAFAQGTTAPPTPYKVIPVTEGGVIEGRVTFQGPLPKLDPLPAKTDLKVCDKLVPRDQLIVGSEAGIANTVVFIDTITAGKPLPPSSTITLDQKKCMYEPHVMAAPLGATLIIKNSDPVLHTVHATEGGIHGGPTFLNIATPKNATSKKDLMTQGFFGFMCEVHRWMGAYLHVFPHPYYVVTGPDGKFRIEGVPPGTYTVKAWHEGWKIAGEMAGMIHFESPKVLEQKVTALPNKAASVDFIYRDN